MAGTSSEINVENPKYQDTQASPNDNTNTSDFIEAAALLTIWSILVLNEGAIRLVDTRPDAGFSPGRPPNLALFLSSLGEVLFGLLGLFLGMAAFIFRWYNTSLTKLSLVVQTLLGYFVFIVFVFLRPVYQAVDLQMPRLSGLSLSEDRFIIVLGLLTSFHFCLALQGGQFVFFCRLICAATGEDFLKQKSGNRMRAVFWNANLGLAGLWTLITGAIISSNVGGGELKVPFVSPPNVGRLPGFTIATGFFMMLWAIVGIILAVSAQQAPWYYFLLSGVVYLMAYLNYTIGQLSLMPAPPRGPNPFGGPVAMHGGLVYMVVFLGPFFVHLASKEKRIALADK